MAYRELTEAELEALFAPLLDEVHQRIQALSPGDDALAWALRRRLHKELSYEERGKPVQRRRLKEIKRLGQCNRCAVCQEQLPDKDVYLDRIAILAGYTQDNTRLLCLACSQDIQRGRGLK